MRAAPHYEWGMPSWRRRQPLHLMDSLIPYRVSVPQLGEKLVSRRLGAVIWPSYLLPVTLYPDSAIPMPTVETVIGRLVHTCWLLSQAVYTLEIQNTIQAPEGAVATVSGEAGLLSCMPAYLKEGE